MSRQNRPFLSGHCLCFSKNSQHGRFGKKIVRGIYAHKVYRSEASKALAAEEKMEPYIIEKKPIADEKRVFRV